MFIEGFNSHVKDKEPEWLKPFFDNPRDKKNEDYKQLFQKEKVVKTCSACGKTLRVSEVGKCSVCLNKNS